MPDTPSFTFGDKAYFEGGDVITSGPHQSMLRTTWFTAKMAKAGSKTLSVLMGTKTSVIRLPLQALVIVSGG